MHIKIVHIFSNHFLLFIIENAAGSAAWLGRGLSCVCAQRRDMEDHPSFDLTPAQVIFSLVELFSSFSFSFGACVAFTGCSSSIRKSFMSSDYSAYFPCRLVSRFC